MATMYGFRVHTIQPRVRRTQEFLEVDDVSEAGGARDALEQVHNELLTLMGRTYVGRPTFFQSDADDAARQSAIEDSDEEPYFTLLDVKRIGRTLELIVETGKEADHDGLRARDGSTESLKRKAAIRRSVVLLHFPKKGREAFMVSETRGRTWTGELVIQWMTRTAQRASVVKDSEGIRKEEAPWLGWKITPRIDGQRLDGILNGSSEHTLRLRRQAVNPQGTRTSYDLELVQFGLKKTPIQKVLDVLMAMAERKNEDAGTEAKRRAAAAADVLTLIEPDVGGVGFNDGEVSFLERGKRQTINAETVDQLFIYPLGTSRPSPEELRARSAEVIQGIAPTLGIQVDFGFLEEEG